MGFTKADIVVVAIVAYALGALTLIVVDNIKSDRDCESRGGVAHEGKCWNKEAFK